MIYAKCHQRDALYNFYKLDETRQPVGVEMVCFLSLKPAVSFIEYDRSQPGDRIEIEVIERYYSRISEAEYKIAYRQATTTDFVLHLIQ